ncbi:16162_t:CDS:1, partial [Funneliformis mosseae]
LHSPHIRVHVWLQTPEHVAALQTGPLLHLEAAQQQSPQVTRQTSSQGKALST